MSAHPDLFGDRTACQRCGAPLRVGPPPDPDATMLRRAQTPQGYCATCAAHDWLRNTYPVNVLLAQGRPERLLHPQVQQQFAAIMQAAGSDADPAEIDWDRLVANWDRPFPTPIRRSAQNPYDEADLAREAQRPKPWERPPEAG